MISHVRNLIIANPPVFAEVGNRVYPLEFPTTDNILPAIVLHDTAGKKHITKGWESDLVVTIWAMSSTTEHGYDIAKRVASNVISLLQGYRGGGSSCYIHTIDDPRMVPAVDRVDDFSLFKIHITFNVIWEER